MPSLPMSAAARLLLPLLLLEGGSAAAAAALEEPSGGAAACPQGLDDAQCAAALAGDDQCGGGGCALSALQVRGDKLGLNASAAGSYRCASDLDLGPVKQGSQKGLCLDDTTFRSCAGAIPQTFPNTNEGIKSLRLFKPWDPEWPAGDRVAAWANVVAYVKQNGVKVLLGTEVTCNKNLDRQSWVWTKELLHMLGPQHVMGLAIGNELELLSKMGNRRKAAPVTPQCITELWSGGYFHSTFQGVVAEFDAMGFGQVPVTTVLGGYALAGNPFVDTHEAKVGTFLRSAVARYGHRFVFTFNFYPYFDNNMHLDYKGARSCNRALGGATSWSHHGFMPGILRAARGRVAKLSPGSRVWLGETGWSSPFAPSLESQMKACAEWSSAKTLRKFYQDFLKWGLADVEHVFFFTARDSEVFGVTEHFGLISTCGTSSCKLTSSNAQKSHSRQHSQRHNSWHHSWHPGWRRHAQDGSEEEASLEAAAADAEAPSEDIWSEGDGFPPSRLHLALESR